MEIIFSSTFWNRNHSKTPEQVSEIRLLEWYVEGMWALLLVEIINIDINITILKILEKSTASANPIHIEGREGRSYITPNFTNTFSTRL